MTPLLRLYRVLAYIVGTALVILVFVGVPLQVWAHNDGLEKIVGGIHGFLYIAYFLLSLTLAYRYRFSLVRTICSLAAGLVPIMTFVAEHSNERFVRAKIAASEQPAVSESSPTSAN